MSTRTTLKASEDLLKEDHLTTTTQFPTALTTTISTQVSTHLAQVTNFTTTGISPTLMLILIAMLPTIKTLIASMILTLEMLAIFTVTV